MAAAKVRGYKFSEWVRLSLEVQSGREAKVPYEMTAKALSDAVDREAGKPRKISKPAVGGKKSGLAHVKKEIRCCKHGKEAGQFCVSCGKVVV